MNRNNLTSSRGNVFKHILINSFSIIGRFPLTGPYLQRFGDQLDMHQKQNDNFYVILIQCLVSKYCIAKECLLTNLKCHKLISDASGYLNIIFSEVHYPNPS